MPEGRPERSIVIRCCWQSSATLERKVRRLLSQIVNLRVSKEIPMGRGAETT